MPSLTNPPQDGGQPNPQPAGLMFLQPEIIALPVFAVVMAVAAFEDFRRLVIPNLLPVILCIAWPLHFAAAPSLIGALGAIGCALAVFLVGAALFARGFLGGGDVKLLTAATLWAGAAGTPSLLVLTGVLGGALTLFLLMPFGAQLAEASRAFLAPSAISADHDAAKSVPYGVAIAGAGLIVILSPHFG
jgi:prepilin peptidase CpaA